MPTWLTNINAVDIRDLHIYSMGKKGTKTDEYNGCSDKGLNTTQDKMVGSVIFSPL